MIMWDDATTIRMGNDDIAKMTYIKFKMIYFVHRRCQIIGLKNFHVCGIRADALCCIHDKYSIFLPTRSAHPFEINKTPIAPCWEEQKLKTVECYSLQERNVWHFYQWKFGIAHKATSWLSINSTIASAQSPWPFRATEMDMPVFLHNSCHG